MADYIYTEPVVRNIGVLWVDVFMWIANLVWWIGQWRSLAAVTRYELNKPKR
ncbi:MAG: hypothetical protein JNM00_08365 [Flavobacteriales bacterium]|nr:hypothetical protein [Flavobacteriales bacterium]